MHLVAVIDWGEGQKRSKPVSVTHLRVHPVPEGQFVMAASQVGQSVVVTSGPYAHQRGKVVRVTGPRCSVRLQDDAFSRIFSKESLHVLSRPDGLTDPLPAPADTSHVSAKTATAADAFSSCAATARSPDARRVGRDALH
jgi:hypothetical protein